jgi:Holliday junction resolvasome RuvABC DNA-binding subunit
VAAVTARRSAEEMLAELQRLIALWRAHRAAWGDDGDHRAEVIRAIRKLGYSAADAKRYVDSKERLR